MGGSFGLPATPNTYLFLTVFRAVEPVILYLLSFMFTYKLNIGPFPHSLNYMILHVNYILFLKGQNMMKEKSSKYCVAGFTTAVRAWDNVRVAPETFFSVFLLHFYALLYIVVGILHSDLCWHLLSWKDGKKITLKQPSE